MFGEWRYRWANSTDQRLVRMHHKVDAMRSAWPRVTISRSDDAFVLAYVGIPDGLSYVLPFLEQQIGSAMRRESYRTSWATVEAGGGVRDADIVAIGLLPGRVLVPPGPYYVELPLRVNLVVHLGPERGSIAAGLSRKARQQHNREWVSRRRSLEVAGSETDFVSFYDRMHIPTMRRRHGASVRTVSRPVALESLFRRGLLFFLQEEGERMAGMLCRLDSEGLVLRLTGVLDGAERLYRTGTYLALYVSILEWAAHHGIQRVDLSGTEPFLSKGIFQFKRKLHPEVCRPANHFAGKRLCLSVRRDTPAVRDFLVANPILVAGQAGLVARYFHDAIRPPRLDLRWQTGGVTECQFIDLDKVLAG